ncbi:MULTISPECIES: hypothetical protein [Photorhabdus]|nr:MULTISPECIES: hypothetical protein [Photorhabdus]KGM27782.1 hypothetical protein KS18_12950 [Photorhabdus luminescens]MCC8457968.1 hypothetical protein [Photorhabdus aegyptia]
MKYVGFMGGSSMVELDSPSDMINFFTFLYSKVNDCESKKILDRLYKKYIRQYELEKISFLVKKIRNDFLTDSEMCFIKYLDGIDTCIESAKLFYSSWGIYQPLKIGITDVPHYIDDKDRPLEQYDALGPDDPPFWLR